MKRLLFILLFFSFGTSVMAQNYYDSGSKEKKINMNKELNEYPKENILSIEPITFFIGGFVMGYERFLSPTTSFKVKSGYFYREDPAAYSGDFNYFEGFNLKFSYKKYINHVRENEGNLYISPFALYKQIELEENNQGLRPVPVTKEASAAAIGIMVGTSLVLDDTPFFIDIAIGGGMYFPTGNGSHDVAHILFVNHYKKGVGPQLDFAFGYSF
jgi:hypothetical protein